MTAYSAVFLLKVNSSLAITWSIEIQLFVQLLRSSNTFSQLKETAHDIHVVISETADAYQEASQLCPPSTSAAYHARFLRSLVSNDVFRTRQNDQKRQDAGVPIDPRLQSKSPVTAFHLNIHLVYNQVCPVPMRQCVPRVRYIPIKYN
jgi:hypothetical protein